MTFLSILPVAVSIVSPAPSAPSAVPLLVPERFKTLAATPARLVIDLHNVTILSRGWIRLSGLLVTDKGLLKLFDWPLELDKVSGATVRVYAKPDDEAVKLLLHADRPRILIQSPEGSVTVGFATLVDAY